MLRWLRGAKAQPAPADAPGPSLATISFPKFHDGLPNAQAAVDIFKGRWASLLPEVDGAPLAAGESGLFTMDPKPGLAAMAFGGGTGRLDGFKVLDLGPLEGGLAYGLEALGADVLAIEGNAEAYLKCLIAKEILGMKSKFMLGDFIRQLEEIDESYDLICASGVLYHMTQPLKLIELVCRRGARSLVWTHYYDPDRVSGYAREDATYNGVTAPHYRKSYGDQTHGRFWGGLADSACWLPRDEILRAFRAFGHSRAEVVAEDVNNPHGPCFTIVTSR
jgi:hypothetical protein